MFIVIKITDKKINIFLKKNKEEIVDSVFWAENKNLSQRLLVEIDNLLKKNNLTAKNIVNVDVDTKIDDRFTTVRIAQIIAKTFNEVRY